MRKSKRRLFCELSPLTYRISCYKCCLQRRLQNAFSRVKFAAEKQTEPFGVSLYRHSSLIRRTLGNVNSVLQENKAVNLGLAAPKINGIVIYPGETFSFWKLVGKPSKSRGYRDGLAISNGETKADIGGGMCQFTNLIHWMVLHSPLTITERHHHDGYDLFPDFNRTVPFGTGTSILYNYLDYRFKNTTLHPVQLLVWVDDKCLNGELKSSEGISSSFHVVCEEEHFTRENGIVYRNGRVFRDIFDKHTGNRVERELLQENHAKVMYDTSSLTIIEKNI